jgi:hypothetical protein
MLGVSQGTVKCAMATCGLPRGLSQLSSKAVHRSAPKNGGAPAMPISCALGARMGNSSEGRTGRHRRRACRAATFGSVHHRRQSAAGAAAGPAAALDHPWRKVMAHARRWPPAARRDAPAVSSPQASGTSGSSSPCSTSVGTRTPRQFLARGCVGAIATICRTRAGRVGSCAARSDARARALAPRRRGKAGLPINWNSARCARPPRVFAASRGRASSAAARATWGRAGPRAAGTHDAGERQHALRRGQRHALRDHAAHAGADHVRLPGCRSASSTPSASAPCPASVGRAHRQAEAQLELSHSRLGTPRWSKCCDRPMSRLSKRTTR